MGTVARYGNCFFQSFRIFVAFGMAQNNMRLRTDVRMLGANIEIIASNRVCKFPVCVYFVSKGYTCTPISLSHRPCISLIISVTQS